MTATDIVYGRQGGRWLPTQSKAERAAIFEAAIAGGTVVRCACMCTVWWLIPRQIGAPCGHCGEPVRPWKDPKQPHRTIDRVEDLLGALA